MDQYRYLLYPIPLHWSAEQAAAALHALEQLEHAIRQAYATELQNVSSGQAADRRAQRRPHVPRKPCSCKRAKQSIE
jgi:hypothetical protein